MRVFSYALAASLLALGLAGQANTAHLGFTNAPAALLNASLSALELPGAGTAAVNDSNGGGQLSSPQIPAGVLAMNGLERLVAKP